MMRMKSKLTSRAVSGSSGAVGEAAAVEWEMRPGGMLVQKRLHSDHNSQPPPTIRVRVKYGLVYHEITISSHSTFGELKKKLTGPTRLHHEDQKLLFKHKGRDSKAYLDISGVKDKSKLVLLEDPISQEKRLLEMRKNAKSDKAAKSISEIALQIDRLAGQVSALESVISNGRKVADKDVLNVIELLMNEVIKLDAIVAHGDVKLQRKTQVNRVQKYVETLDMLKIKNSMPSTNRSHQNPTPNQQQHSTRQQRQSIGPSPLRPQQPQSPPTNPTQGTVVTTQWETFDSTPILNPTSSPPPLIPLSPTAATIGPGAYKQPQVQLGIL